MPKNNLRVFTQEHRDKIGKARKALYDSGEITTWSKGKKMTRDHTLKNMKAHLKYDVSLEWLNSFSDIEKLKYLNRSISKKRDYIGFDSELYISFIERFYYDEGFNSLHTKWIETGDKWIKPSLDHIEAKCKGGRLNILNNLQFISWFENRAKMDIEQSRWNEMKQRINEYF